MKVSKVNIYALVYASLVFLFSVYLSPLFVNGDQEFYRYFYNDCFKYEGLDAQYFCYNSSLSTQEPIYFYIAKISQYFFNKDLFVSVANFILVFFLIKIIFKYFKDKKTVNIFIVLVLVNYYTFVLFFSAERLKFSLIFILFSFFFVGYKSYFFKILMLFTHIQTIFLFAATLIYSFFYTNNKIWVKVLGVALSSVFISIFYFIMQEHIGNKLYSYSERSIDEDSGFTSLIKSLFFLIISYFSTRQVVVVLMHLPLIFASYFLGSSRILILSFFVYISMLVYFKGGLDLLGFLLLFYFALKSLGFWSNVIAYGSGFPIV